MDTIKSPKRFSKKLAYRWRTWWRKQSPVHQDKFALFAPLTAVILFLAAIFAAFAYLRYEEMLREQESLRSDVEYIQQHVRLRVLERQEQAFRIANDIIKDNLSDSELKKAFKTFIRESPELNSVALLGANLTTKQSETSNIIDRYQQIKNKERIEQKDSLSAFNLAKEMHQSIYSKPFSNVSGKKVDKNLGTSPLSNNVIQLFIPMYRLGEFEGALMTEFNLDGLLRNSVPNEINTRDAVAIIDPAGKLIAGHLGTQQKSILPQLPWSTDRLETTAPLSPFGDSLLIKASNYRTSQGLIGNGLFRLIAALSLLTAWMLIGTWRHTKRRLQAQEALIAETNFRRAMENSVLTGMRAMDLKGTITYVNAAFCQMTGWSEKELVGQSPPFPYWPEAQIATLSAMLQNELKGLTPSGGHQVKVKHRLGKIFDARLYVSPLVDAYGVQTGWMTSMTDITEPNRIRDQLSASHERFTTVLEALDAAVSVTPLGSSELLFANKLYRLWFENASQGHLSLVERAGMPQSAPQGDKTEDDLAGLPSTVVTESLSENAEIFVPELEKWLEVRARYLNWVDGRLAQMVIATDITARKKAQEQAKIQELQALASSRLITMGEMASSVAHELNQPLAAITNYCTGMTSRIKNKQIVESELLIALEKTTHQAQRAGQIIQRIRSFVKKSAANQVPTDVTSTVMEAIELAEIEIKRRRVRFSHYFGPRLPLVSMDKILIQQVLINLLKNAAESVDQTGKESPHRYVELSVNAVNAQDQQRVEFVVKDSGAGIASEVLDRLFEAFFSTKSEGLGIGLNLCRSIIESHQGRIQAQNLYNGDHISGCCFTFWLPAIGYKMPAVENISNDARSY
jgi:PAS domain S-box-containing protein